MLLCHSTIFHATCLATLEKEINCKFQESCYTLQSGAATCNCFKTVHAIVAESRTELYLVNALQPPKGARQVAERACYTLKPNWNQRTKSKETMGHCNERCLLTWSFDAKITEWSRTLFRFPYFTSPRQNSKKTQNSKMVIQTSKSLLKILYI